MSELLKWVDVELANREIHLTCGVVCQHVGSLKTATWQKPIPMAAGLSALWLDWRRRCPYNQFAEYIFRIPREGRYSTAMAFKCDVETLRAAPKRAGSGKHVRWHVFQDTFATLLKEAVRT